MGRIQADFASEIVSDVSGRFQSMNDTLERCERERVLFLQRAERLEKKVEEQHIHIQALLAQQTPRDLVPFLGLRGGDRYVRYSP